MPVHGSQNGSALKVGTKVVVLPSVVLEVLVVGILVWSQTGSILNCEADIEGLIQFIPYQSIEQFKRQLRRCFPRNKCVSYDDESGRKLSSETIGDPDSISLISDQTRCYTSSEKFSVGIRSGDVVNGTTDAG